MTSPTPHPMFEMTQQHIEAGVHHQLKDNITEGARGTFAQESELDGHLSYIAQEYGVDALDLLKKKCEDKKTSTKIS